LLPSAPKRVAGLGFGLPLGMSGLFHKYGKGGRLIAEQ
jgi:hypothetical protein